MQEETTFVDVTVWGKTAENVSQYLSKGRPVFIEGRLTLDSWETQDGQKRNKLKVTADNVQFLGSAGGGGGEPHRERSPQQRRDSAPSSTGRPGGGERRTTGRPGQQSAPRQEPEREFPDDEFNLDEVPFDPSPASA